ncbi:uncharacterized protein N7446_006064 [Penicillium canescens]|uniref:Uncharacterized protein n=1 Tax=Penicillium canescens TaxID=5083 RepID=A0AAD6ND90_PENCN|nr:uncharacterized protein N7446_006064 [Penicillium canescens]KAJ6051432.1 hypothetical protein N7460_001966 [Penicillium canescens]KAJ6061944.1 hypothetical protein N7446_006064 [Penicillium canescens]
MPHIRFPSSDGDGKNGKGKDADMGFGPRRLKRDVDYWLSPDCGNVNMVITIKARREIAEINIQTWKMINERPHREHSVFTRSTKQEQEPTIPAEKNIVLSKQRLQSIAEDIWEDQEI